MRDLLIALIVFGSIPFILLRPYLGLLMWSWLGYMNPYRLAYGFAYSFPWVQLIAIVTLASLIFSKESKKVPVSPISVLLFLFLAWTGVTSFFAVDSASAWIVWQEFAKIQIMVFVTLMLVNTRQRMHWLVWIIVISIGFYGLKGGMFTLLKGGMFNVLGPPGSFIADNNALALALCMVLPLMRYLQLHTKMKWVYIGLGISMFLTSVAVLGTYSRGGLIALAVVCGILFLRSRGRIAVVAVVIVVGFAAFHFMPPQWMERMDTLHNAENTDSGQTRIQSWQFAINVALNHPIVGGGFRVYESDAWWKRYGPQGAIQRAVHSIYFSVLGDQGFPGLVLFVGLLMVSWWSCSRVRKKTRSSSDQKWGYDLASMLQVSLVAYMAAGIFLPMAYFDLVYQLIAMCLLLHTLIANEETSSSRSAISDPIMLEKSKTTKAEEIVSE